MNDLAKMMERGCGIVCVHYGVGLGKDDVATDGDHSLLHWMGGYFATRCDHHQSVARIYPAAKIEPVDRNHPITYGWSAFTIRDEPYINNYFGPDNNQLLPGAFVVATSMLPPNKPKREVVAWGIERDDSGRGFGVTLPHLYRNWEVERLRKFILSTALFGQQSRRFPRRGWLRRFPNWKPSIPSPLTSNRRKRSEQRSPAPRRTFRAPHKAIVKNES